MTYLLLGLLALMSIVFVGCMGVFVGFCLARIDDLYHFTDGEEPAPRHSKLQYYSRSLN